jgi:gliding motility-associated-like protein
MKYNVANNNNKEAGQKLRQGRSLNCLYLLLFFLFLTPLSLLAQENCFNGIDDDGDNLIDVFDPDCPCDEQTLICKPSCEFAIPGGPLNFKSQWTSIDEVPIYQTPLVADMDGDSIPDVIIMSADSMKGSDPRRSRNILIISGATGQTIAKIITPYMGWVGPNPYAVADIDSDGFGEIIIASIDHADNPASERRYLYCYEHTGALKWKSNTQYGNGSNARFGSSVGIADFNRDGIPEVYVYNQIFNALTGRKVIDGGTGNGYSIMTNQAFGDLANPIAADILTSNPGLELACGNTVYRVVLTNNGGLPGNSMTPIRITGQPDGYTSLADINLDGKMDIVVAAEGATGKLYVWNPNEGSPVLIATTNLPNTGGNWVGVPFIGDMDKDCAPEIGVTRASRVFAFEYDGTPTLSQKWALTTSDASGFTGITMFDFNQDGTQELVYRDETSLRIFDGSGSTPVVIGSNPCASGTGSEMPVVADVDGDGQAEICVTCATTGIQYGRVNVFKSSGQAWAPCRPIWNQYNYFNVNINTNLTIPRQQQPHQVLLSTNACPFYTCNENRPFNSFLAQSTFLTQEGCPIYPASDVKLDLVSQQCQGASVLNLVLKVTNDGGSPSEPSYPVRFYAGNPFTGPASRISSSPDSIRTNGRLNPGESVDIPVTLDIKDFPKPFRLSILLNDDGSKTIPFNFPITSLPECDYVDNVVVVADLDCCPAGDLAIDSITPPSATFCSGSQTNIEVHASSTEGLGSNSYTWTLPNNSNVAGKSVLAASGGTYNIQVQDSAHCRVNGSVQITEIQQPTTASAGPDQTVCAETATLQGNTPNVGTGLWTVLEGTALVTNPALANSGITLLSPGLNRFRWTITNGGICISDDTVSIVRDIMPSAANAGPDQQICADAGALAAIQPLVGTGRWSVISGGGTIADTSLINSAISGLSVGNNVFRFTVRNGVCQVRTDDIIVTRFAPPSLANAGPNQTICTAQTALLAEVPAVGTGVWSLVSGNGQFSDSTAFNSTVSGLTSGDHVFRWTVTNGPCAASTDEVLITRNAAPAVADAGSDQQICTDASALGAVVPLVGTGSWSLVSGSGTIADTLLPNSAVSGLGFGDNVFAWTVRSGVCPPSVDQITIRRDTPPSASNAGANQQICADSSVLAATSPLIGTGTWSLISGAGTIANPASPGSSVNGLGVGNNVFQWEVRNGVCPAATSTVTILVDAPASVANAGANIQACSPNAVLNATVPLVGTGLWTLVAGTATITTPTAPNSAVSGLGFGTARLRWTVSNGTCKSTDEVLITRFRPPSAAVAGPDQLICAAAASLDANIPLTGTGAWSVISGSATFGNNADPKDQVSNLATGENLLVWTISNGTCTPTKDTVKITVSANPVVPNAGNDTSYCADAGTFNAAAPSIGTGSWSVISGAALIADTLDPQSAFSNLQAGTNTFRWTVVNGACRAFDLVNIRRDMPPSNAVAGDDQTICSDSTILSASQPVNGNGLWTLVSGQAEFADSSQAQTSVRNMLPGLYTLVWTVSSGVCTPETDSMNVTVQARPTPPQAGADQTICADTLVLGANTPANGIGTWSLVSGNATFDDSLNAATTVRGMLPGTTILRWTIRNGVCPPLSDELSIVRDSLPGAADAGDDQQVCADTVRLSANLPIAGTGSWTIVSGAGTFADPNAPNSLVTGLGQGVNVFQWNLQNGNCPPSTDQVVIIRDSVATQANAGADIRLCASDSAQLQGNDPFPATGLWTLISGNAVFADPTSPTTTVSGLGGQDAVLRWTITPASCVGSFDEVSIINEAAPDTASAGNDTTLCGTTLRLSAKTPLVGNGQWQVHTGTGQLDNENLANTQVTNLSIGENRLVWTVSNGNCTPSTDTLVINVDDNPISPNAGSDQMICQDTTRLSAAIPAVGTGSWTLVSGTGTISDSSNAGSFVSGLGAGVNIFRWTVSNGLCKVFDELAVRRDLPPDPALAGADQLICDSVLTLAANTPLVGNGTWSLISGNAQIDSTGKANAVLSGIQPGTIQLRWTIKNGVCRDTADDVNITRQQAPSKAHAGADQQICLDTALLQADPVLFGKGSWSVISGTAQIDSVHLPGSVVRGLSQGTHTLRWTVADTAACPGSFDEVVITRDTPPSTAVLGADTALCGDSIQLSANAPVVGIGNWIVVGGNASISDSTSTTTQFTKLSIGNNVFEWRISNGSCPPSTDQITVFRSDTANAGADQIVCDSVATLDATGALSGNGVWTILSGNGILADSSLENTQVTNLSEGTNVFVWTISGSLCSDTTDTVTITRKCNIPPVLANDSFAIQEDSLLVDTLLTVADYDPDSTQLRVDTIPVSGPAHGRITLNPDGSFVFKPDTNYYGLDTIVVRVCDNGIPLPPICENDTLFIVIHPVNDAPLIYSEDLTTPVDSVLTGNILANGDADPDSTTLVVDTIPLSGPTHGTFVIDSTGQFTYTPDTSFAGADTILIRVCDQGFPLPPMCGTDTLIILVKPKQNIPPVITPDSLILLEDESGSGSLLVGDFDPDNTTLSVDTVPLSGPSHGTIRLNPDGSYTYTPEPDYYGYDTVIVAVCDSGFPLPAICLPDTLTIRIDPVNDAPQIVNDTVVTTPNAAVTGNLMLNDSDKETALSADSIPLLGPAHGQIVVQPDGAYTYTPDTGYVGLDTVVVMVCDSGFPLPAICKPDTLFIWVRDTSQVLVNAGDDQTICTDSTRLNSTPAQAPGLGFWTFAAGSGQFADSTIASTMVFNLSTGVNRLVWTIRSGLQEKTDTVIITVQQAPTKAQAGADQTICGDSTLLEGNLPMIGTGVWTSISGSSAIKQPDSSQTPVLNMQAGQHLFVWTISNGTCVSSDTMQVSAWLMPNAFAGVDSSICPTDEEFKLYASDSGAVTSTWSVLMGNAIVNDTADAQSVVSGFSPGLNILLYTVSNGPCVYSDSLQIILLNGDSIPCKVPEVFIPEGFSPDEDGVNDKFVIYGVNGKRISLLVFNRWGTLVYESNNYLNNWDGTCNQPNVLSGDYLPEGTYFYIVKIEGETDHRKGYLTLWR